MAEQEHDLQDIHDTLLATARRVAETIVSADPSKTGAKTKLNVVDLVTETDKAVEDMIKQTLTEKYPQYKFYGEETYSADNPLTSDPTFVVDPIDGTCNFFHNNPYVCVSLGFAVNRKAVVGVVYSVYSGKYFSAIRGRGAFVDGVQKLPLSRGGQVQPLGTLSESLVALEWGVIRSGPDYKVLTDTMVHLARHKSDGGAGVHAIRSYGSAALNLCQIAAGWLDAYWECGLWAWDACAGSVILEEAGGRMVNTNPGQWTAELDGRRFFAVRAGENQEKFIEEFWSHVQGKFQLGG